MKKIAFGLCLLIALACLLPGSSPGQYMYIDTNGDGEHTDADVIHPAGVTTLDLWLRTDSNRDGSAATCVTGDGDLTMTGYEFNLRANNGLVAWGAFTNRVAGVNVGSTSSATEFRAGGSGANLPPGSYFLGTVLVTVASGTPNVSIVPRSALAGSFGTGFGSQCSGIEFTNTLRLGVDWFDVDGAAYGGVANRLPVLDPIPALTVREGTILEHPLAATDQDGDPLQFTKRSGPSYLAVSTVDAGTGAATGLARLMPGLTDAGTTMAIVEVSDGQATDAAEIQITVTEDARPPVLEQPENMTIPAGQFAEQELHATDPDGGPLQFSLVTGPEYLTVLTVDPASPAVGRIEAAPTQEHAGRATATVAVSDGQLRDERTFELEVLQFFVTPPLLCRPYNMTVTAGTQAVQTLMGSSFNGEPLSFHLESGPAFVQVTTQDTDHHPQTGLLMLSPTAADLGVHTVVLGVSDGDALSYEALRVTVVDHPVTLAPKPDLLTSSYRAYDVGFLPQSASAADLNEDGLADLVVANQGCGISVYFGIGGGQSGDRRDYHTEGEPRSATALDLDLDGHVDVAVAAGFANRLFVLSGDGTGALTITAELGAGPNVTHVAAGDLNRDGTPDLVGANEDDGTISVYLGLGARTYSARQDYPGGLKPCYTSIVDLNHDGIPDLAEATEGAGELSILLGNGDGTFQPRTAHGGVSGPTAVEAGDFDEDGNVDLAVPNFHGASVDLFFGDGGGGISRRTSPDVGRAPWSVCVADLNGDSHDDIAAANTVDHSVSVLLGRGDGTFEPEKVAPAGILSRFVIAAELSGDGTTDLVVVNEGSGTIMILSGNGNGTFGSARLFPTENEAFDVAVGDLNGDGHLDLFATNTADQSILFYAGLEHGAFASPVALHPGDTPEAVLVADVTGDGPVDLMVALPTLGSVGVYPGGPGFGTAPPTLFGAGMHPSQMVVADWTRDGRLDLAVTSQSTPVISILHGAPGGFGERHELTVPNLADRLGAGDFDGDGMLDLAATQEPNGILIHWGADVGFTPGPLFTELDRVTGFASTDLDGDAPQELAVTVEGKNGGYYGVPHGQLALYDWADRNSRSRSVYPAGPLPRQPAIVDLDGDGHRDLLITVGGGGVSVYPGEAGGSFGPREDYGASIGPFASAVGDVDGDGRPDVVTAGYRGIAVLLNLTRDSSPPLQARAFLPSGDRTIHLRSAKPSVCLQLEPVGATFSLEDLDVASLRLGRADSDVEPIAPVPSKRGVLSDTDRNGIAEIAVCFAKEAVRGLFADLSGPADVAVVLSGSLTEGRRIEARLDVRVVPGPAGGPPLAARIAPNPMNPVSTLTFVTDRAGPVRVTIFDVHGRTVTTLLDSKLVEPGEHQIRVGAGARPGSELASGIYFFRVETRDDRVTGRFAVLK